MDSSPLRTYREQHSPPLSQEALGGRLGVSKATISRWEAGLRKIHDDMLPKVSKITGLSMGVLRPDLAAFFQSEAAE